MNAYRIHTRIPTNHLLHIPVPTFAVGEEVEITILAKADSNVMEAKIRQMENAAHDPLFLADLQEAAASTQAKYETRNSTLHGTLLRYDDPTEPISPDDWEALQ